LETSFIHKKFPSLIIAEVSGFDDNDRVAYDAVLQAETGFLSMNGSAESGEMKMPIAFIDLFAAHQLKEGVLLALLHKQRTGKGAVVRTSLYRSAIASLANQASNWLNNGNVPQLLGSLHPNIAPYGETFTTKDKHKILLAVGTDEQFQKLCSALGISFISDNPLYQKNVDRVKNRNELYALLSPLFLKSDSKNLLSKFHELKVPAGKINNLSEVFENNIAKKMILKQVEADGTESKRVQTIAFQINFHE
jgi:crotonobetainyl-CoA:carnitine CoA-transferase CaiB-like acyl-CoA transferase